MIMIKNVSYDIGEKRILNEISVDIKDGRFTAIVGPNGSGKSTLLNIIAGIYKPTKGQVIIFDKRELSKKDRVKISYVQQKATSFNMSFPISVLEATLLGLVPKKKLFQRYSKNDIEKAKEILEMLELYQYKDKSLGKLSGGQQQRVFIARALISEPQLLLLDEPTVGIDSKSEEILYSILAKIKEKGTTIVMVTHDIFAVTKNADEVICMGEGQIYTACSINDFSPSKYEKLYKYDVKKLSHKHSHYHVKKDD
ncbi:metal ABC transporter ATP-binding protein [Caldicellulosiruptoraceae bacterium PP1]